MASSLLGTRAPKGQHQADIDGVIAQAIKHSNFFMNSMRVGVLPADNSVSYRANSLTYESGPGGSDLTGGWLTGGGAGNLKMTMPTAFATSMLAWGLLAFPKGFSNSGQTAQTLENVK